MKALASCAIVVSLSFVIVSAQGGAPAAAGQQPAQGERGRGGRGAAGAPGEGREGRGGGRGARTPNVVNAPDLGYRHVLNALQWPTATVGEPAGAAGIGIDSKGRVIVFQRAAEGKPPIVIFDQNDRFLTAFGQDLGVVRAHGMHIDAEDNIWISDVGTHQVTKLSPEGKVLMILGTKGQVGKSTATATLFDQPTDLGFDRAGNVYIANSHGGPDPRVDKFDKAGKFLTSWRVEPKASDRGNNHTIAVEPDGTVYAVSREDRLIRVYDTNGKELRSFDMPALVCGLYFDPSGKLWMTTGVDGQLITMDKMTGRPTGVTGRGPGREAGQYGEAHYVAMSRQGDLYISDTVANRTVKLVKQ